MVSIRKKFIALTSAVSPLVPLNLLYNISGRRFILPFYHVVSNEQCPHIQHLYKYKNIQQFERDIDYLAKEYMPIAADELENVLQGKYKGKKIMLLSFDDGLRQMYEVVAPILLRKGIPAIFFLNTDFVDNKLLMFRYKISLIIHRLQQLGVTDPSVLSIRSEEELQNKLASLPPVDFAAFLKDYQPYMSTGQVQWLVDKGFAVGGHSCSHPYFIGLTFEEQLSQTLNSVEKVTTDFNAKQKLFAFPFTDDGVSKRFFDSVFLDNRIDFSFGSAGIKADVHLRQLQRIPMEASDYTAEQILKSEYLYYLLRMPLFKNTIRRK